MEGCKEFGLSGYRPHIPQVWEAPSLLRLTKLEDCYVYQRC